ncbi:MAG: hypothetical protein R2850_05785 [Bacteroidia bacterium]
MNIVLEDLQDRDDNIYRVIFEADPIPDEVRKAGFGSKPIQEVPQHGSTDLVVETMKKAPMYLPSSWLFRVNRTMTFTK